MELNDWILALHLLSAFALVGAMTLFSILIVALWRCDSPSQVAALMRPAQVGNVLVIIGTLGTIVFGVWLAISLDAYKVWDGWVDRGDRVVGGASEVGRRAGAAVRGRREARQRSSVRPASRPAPNWPPRSGSPTPSGSTSVGSSWFS